MNRDGVWHKSSRSQFDGNCVEVCPGWGNVGVRNSRDPDGSVLLFPPQSFRDFVDGAKAGHYDREDEMGGS